MSILIDKATRVVIVGITGKFGSFSLKDIPEAGTKVVAGVAPSHAGQAIQDVPVFATMAEALRETDANAALIYVPAIAALDAVLEAIEAGCPVIAYPGDGLPVNDAIELRAAAKANGVRLVGPNTPGLISPGKAKLGFMPTFCFKPGPIGLISRSGSLSYECAFRLSNAGLGQTTAIGIGGDPIRGTNAAEAIELFDKDPETKAIVYLGEIGGTEEYALAEYARQRGSKPVAAMLVGRTAPVGKKMGHAAALIGTYAELWTAKVEALEAAGVRVARSLEQLPIAAHDAINSVLSAA